jgi:hypothetical protein
VNLQTLPLDPTIDRPSGRTSRWKFTKWFCAVDGAALLLRGGFDLTMTDLGAPQR